LEACNNLDANFINCKETFKNLRIQFPHTSIFISRQTTLRLAVDSKSKITEVETVVVFEVVPVRFKLFFS